MTQSKYMNDPALEYIRANHNTYTREAITKVLLDAGTAPEVIAAAWQVVDDEDARSQAEDRAPGTQVTEGFPETPEAREEGAGCLRSAFIMAVVVGVPLLILANIGLGSGYFGIRREYLTAENRTLADAALLLVNAGSAVVGIGLVVASLWLLNRKWPMGRVAIVVFVTVLIWLLIVFGTCVYTPQVVRS